MIREGTKVWVRGRTWCAQGIVVGKGEDGEPWIRITNGPRKGEEWSAFDFGSVGRLDNLEIVRPKPRSGGGRKS